MLRKDVNFFTNAQFSFSLSTLKVWLLTLEIVVSTFISFFIEMIKCLIKPWSESCKHRVEHIFASLVPASCDPVYKVDRNNPDSNENSIWFPLK